MELWQSLTEMQQNILMWSVIALIFLGGVGIWYAHVIKGIDFSGFGDWIKSWFE